MVHEISTVYNGVKKIKTNLVIMFPTYFVCAFQNVSECDIGKLFPYNDRSLRVSIFEKGFFL